VPAEQIEHYFSHLRTKEMLDIVGSKVFPGPKKQIKGDNKAILTIFADSRKDSH